MKTSWYKEPWAWLVFVLPAIAVIASITTYFIANYEPDDLVIGDYYKRGKAINLEISKIKLAQKLGMKFALKLTGNELVIKPTGIETKFPLLNVNFYHPTLAKKDFYLALTADANGNFRHHFDTKISGKWRITLSSFKNNWRIENVIYLPQSTFISIEPDLAEAN
ncbi:MAG: FixH family protein [Alteromonadaceae bacterium]|nr:FixH family protein [Alteromonadaceae bacterium]